MKVLGVIGTALLFAYIFAMVIHPLVYGNWDHVHSVWENWQSLNGGILGGMLAIAASIIAFSISSYHESNKKQRQFLSYRAESIQVLSDFFAYFKQSFNLLQLAWSYLRKGENFNTDSSHWILPVTMPQLPDYTKTFTPYIAAAEGEIDKYLRRFLIKLQIFNSRLMTVCDDVNQQHAGRQTSTVTRIIPINILTYLVDLAELFAMAGKLIAYAREDNDTDNLDWHKDLKLVSADFQNAFSIHDCEELIEDANTYFGDSYSVESAVVSRIKKEWGLRD